MTLKIPSSEPLPFTMKAGLHNLERYEYDQIDAINYSWLKNFDVPQAAKWMKDNPGEGDTDALEFGRWYHHRILQPKIFEDLYACKVVSWTHGGGHLKKTATTSTNDGALNRIERATWDSANSGKQIIPADKWLQLHNMRDVLMADPVAGSIFSFPGSLREQTCISQLPDGTWLKSQIDIILELTADEAQAMFRLPGLPGGIWLGDLKTARSANPFTRQWFYSVRDYKYKQQLSFYKENYQRATGVAVAGAFLCPQDKYGGFTPCTYLASERDLEAGWLFCEKMLKAKAECEQQQKWPGYAETALWLPE